MSQSEIIQALRNLGNRAVRSDLIAEYFRLHYPNEQQRKEMLDRNYPIGNVMSDYIATLRREGIITSKRVPRPTGKLTQIEYCLMEKYQ